LKVKGTENTYECPDSSCKKRIRGAQNMDNHMGTHDTTTLANRTCKLEGCKRKGYIYKSNQGYGRHEVSVALDQWHIHLTYNVAPSEANFMQPLLQILGKSKVVVNKVPVVASKVVVVKKAVTGMKFKLTARSVEITVCSETIRQKGVIRVETSEAKNYVGR
jgi:hypothetical protein